VTPPHPYVSRGALKLAHALQHFALDVEGKIIADIGASTGGFTDALLQHGAQKIYAVDVGTDQLHEKLRADDRVVVMESTNAKHLTSQEIEEPLDMIVCDASFIALSKVLPAVLALAATRAQCVALIKPQFEAGKEAVRKGEGVIRDEAMHESICRDVAQWFEGEGWKVYGITPSPIEGPKGNKEFLIWAAK